MKIKNILFLTTTPTVGGNGDALISAAMEEAKEYGAEVYLVHIIRRYNGLINQKDLNSVRSKEWRSLWNMQL